MAHYRHVVEEYSTQPCGSSRCVGARQQAQPCHEGNGRHLPMTPNPWPVVRLWLPVLPSLTGLLSDPGSSRGSRPLYFTF